MTQQPSYGQPSEQPYPQQQQPYGQSPYSQPGPPQRPSGGFKALWVVLAVVALVAVGAVAWIVGSRPGGTTADPSTPPAPPTTEATTDPTDIWGPVLPPNLDDLKDFSDPSFPEQVGAWELYGEPAVGDVTVMAQYFHDDEETSRSIAVAVVFYVDGFAIGVEGLNAPTVVGDAVCESQPDDPDDVWCYVAGSTSTIEIITRTDVSDEEMAEFVSELLELI